GVLILALCFTQVGALGLAQNTNSPDHWVATWAASPQQPPAAGAGQRGPAPAPTVPAGAAVAPAGGATPTAPAAAGRGGQRGAPPVVGLNDQTVRLFVRTSIAGQRLRVEFSNAYGTTPLAIGAAHVALRSKDSAVVAGSDRALSFGGRASVKIPPGASILSDAVALNVPKLVDLAIS